MPDFILMGKAVLISAVVAVLLLLLFAAWPWRRLLRLRLSLGWVLGVGAGFYAGCGVLRLWPRWPPPEDRDRFLLLLLPLTLMTEVVFAVSSRWRWLAWLVRLGVAGAATPILLYNTTYLADLSGPNSAEWSPTQVAVILPALATVLAFVWMLLALLQSQTSDRAVASALALTCAAAGVTVMLSGYLKGGMLGLPLAGALAGAALASFAVPTIPNTDRYLGVGVIGLFGVLLIGRFFGSLPTSTGLCLFLSPLLAWIPECPGLRRLGALGRAAGLILVVVPLILILTNAKRKFDEAYVTPSNPLNISIDDLK